MLNILKLFGRSPFAPLQSHMDQVADCVQGLRELFDAVMQQDFEKLETISKKLSKMEHAADLIKNSIRNHLPKSMFLSIDRHALLEILTLQDGIADTVEDIGIITTLKKMEFPKVFQEDFTPFLEKNIETFERVRSIIQEIDTLVESSFGGIEAEKVRNMVDEVAYLEHQADVIQRRLIKTLFSDDLRIPYTDFHLWQRLFEKVSAIGNISEKLAFRVRMTLEI